MKARLEAATWLAAGLFTALCLTALAACRAGPPPGAVGYLWDPELVGQGVYADGPHGRAEVAVVGKRMFDDGTRECISELTVGGHTLRILTEQSPVWREFGSVQWQQDKAIARYANGSELADFFAVEVQVHAH